MLKPNRVPLAFGAIGALLLTSVSLKDVAAHPHVWIKARAELVMDAKNRLTSVRHAWQFDDGFTSYATLGFKTDKDGKFLEKDLKELAEINMESLAEFEYFTFVQMGKKDPPYEKPKQYWLEHDGQSLTLYFELPMKEPVAADPKKGFKDLTVEIFDATFFVDLQFTKEEPVAVVMPKGVKSACKATIQPRKELDPAKSLLLSEIGPSEDIPEDIAPVEGDLANTIRLSCGTS